MRLSVQLFIYLYLLATYATGQDKIEWSFQFNASRCIEASAKIETGWHLYSIHLDPSAGPVPTAISLEKNKSITLTDTWVEQGHLLRKFDPTFGAEMSYFENDYTLIAPLSVKKQTTVKGELTYMLCDDKRCLPPKTIPFEINVTPFESKN